ncbi:MULTISPECIES: biliverdin-producing heme oxygenase [Actinoplanes]|uniref:Heme oxygenase n=2 Tax=Actinoplanes TaxID=1865 RepID=A0A101JR30_9ACTN|nr:MULTISPECIES: biliverdin-producing heme oxygenase [Actinoplanes]KUL31487.1 heme oxygenase [Actinoplanes awajinensis subsp. mycoplanecinus]GIE68851.1 heme oxygenase [Actinoplanes palleronii]
MWHTADPPATGALLVPLQKILGDLDATARRSRFIQGLVTGRLPVAAYAEFVAQHWFVYESLELATTAMADDPMGGRFYFPELFRIPAIESDLQFLHGPRWQSRIVALPATSTYCTRLRSAAFDKATGFVAHHCTRYLSELDGGQWLGAAVLEAYRFRRQGYRFFVFEGVDPELFRARYRNRLESTPWNRAERDAFLTEVAAAAELNLAVLTDLDNRWT